MTVEEAQRQSRATYLGGAPGQGVCAVLWLASASAGTWATPRTAILILVIGGMFIFPLTQLVLRAMGRPASLPRENPLKALGLQTALIVPLCLPVAGAAAMHRLDWFYPATTIVVGAHYLPFTFLYGQRRFFVLGAFLVATGLVIGLYVSGPFALAGWLTGLTFAVFSAWAFANPGRAEARA